MIIRQHFDKIYKITIKLHNPIYKNTIKIKVYLQQDFDVAAPVSVDHNF